MITELYLVERYTGASRAGLLRPTRPPGSLGAPPSPSEPWAAGGASAALQALGVTSAGRHFRAARAPRRALAAEGTQFDVSRVQLSSERVAPCTPSVLCDAAWRMEAGAVIAIYAINQAQGAMGLCTGTQPKLHWLLGFAGAVPSLHTVSRRKATRPS